MTNKPLSLEEWQARQKSAMLETTQEAAEFGTFGKEVADNNFNLDYDEWPEGGTPERIASINKNGYGDKCEK